MTNVLPLPDVPRAVDYGAVYEQYAKDAMASRRAVEQGLPRGPVTGLGPLDHVLGGCLRPGLYVLHGQPGLGKTALCQQIADTCGTPALFISCEMGLVDLLQRHAARVTRRSRSLFTRAELPLREELRLIRDAAISSPFLSMADGTDGKVTPTVINQLLDDAKAGSPHVLLVIDSLHSWAMPLADRDGMSEYDAINRALLAVRELIKRHNCPVLVTAERNRASMNTGGLSAVAGSRRVEYGADVVLGLSTEDEKADKGNFESGEYQPNRPLTLSLHKNRFGPTGRKLGLVFESDVMAFRSPTLLEQVKATTR